MADQQAALERLRELYREKNEHLGKFLEPVEPYEFYREIFPKGSFERKGHFEDRKGNGIAVTVPKGEVDKATGIALQIEGDGTAFRFTVPLDLQGDPGCFINLTFRHRHRDPVSLPVLKMALPLERSFREDLTIKLIRLHRLQKLL